MRVDWASETGLPGNRLRIIRDGQFISDDILAPGSTLEAALAEILRTLDLALAVAKVELGTDKKRSDTRRDINAKRKATAKKLNAAIQREAKAIRTMEPGIKQDALAGMLEERGFGAKETLLRKLARRNP
jgi:hypothetical protein